MDFKDFAANGTLVGVVPRTAHWRPRNRSDLAGGVGFNWILAGAVRVRQTHKSHPKVAFTGTRRGPISAC